MNVDVRDVDADLDELSSLERIKEESGGLRTPLAGEVDNEESHFTDEAEEVLKFHGIYQQDDRDVRRERKKAGEAPRYIMMIRSKLPGGVLDAEQYLVHDDLAGRYGNDTLRVTTRQGFQLHGVVKEDLKPTIRALNEALVTTLGACGDVERNVMSCSAPLRDGLRDEAQEVARAISDRTLPQTEAYHQIWLQGRDGKMKVVDTEGEAVNDPVYGKRYLPRKFKTAIAFPGDNCTDVYSHDLGFLAVPDGDRVRGFNVLVGGGLGMTHNKPETFPRLADALAFVTPEEAVETAEAVIGVQHDHGNRRNRRRARMKYLVEEQGLAWFRARVEERLGRSLRPPRDVEVEEIRDHVGWHRQDDGTWFYGLFVENGRIEDTADHRLRTGIRELVETLEPGVRLTPQHNVLFTDIDEGEKEKVDDIVERYGLGLAGGVSTVRRWAMACPALPTCGLAITESERALPGVIDELEGRLEELGLDAERLTVRMTGCPNGCSRPYTADVAFVGRSLDKYKVFVGGSVLGTELGFEVADLVHRDDLVETVLPLFERFEVERREDEDFGAFCRRLGEDEVLQTIEDEEGKA